MKHTLLALLVLTPACYAYNTFFAPYDGPYPVSLDTRFEGIVARHPSCFNELKDVFDFNFKGYIKYGNGWFSKLGVNIVSVKIDHLDWSERCIIQRPGVDLQFGKYWPCYGALRFGLFSSGPGIGGDYWLIYRRFKWLTTLEFSGNKFHGCYENDGKFRPLIKWLNRLFIFDGAYISIGVNHLADSKTFERARTQVFLGFGAAV